MAIKQSRGSATLPHLHPAPGGQGLVDRQVGKMQSETEQLIGDRLVELPAQAMGPLQDCPANRGAGNDALEEPIVTGPPRDRVARFPEQRDIPTCYVLDIPTLECVLIDAESLDHGAAGKGAFPVSIGAEDIVMAF